jgi:hypothetical protein
MIFLAEAQIYQLAEAVRSLITIPADTYHNCPKPAKNTNLVNLQYNANIIIFYSTIYKKLSTNIQQQKKVGHVQRRREELFK